jgi:EmrB/QacA subfamily drug resistance transporter
MLSSDIEVNDMRPKSASAVAPSAALITKTGAHTRHRATFAVILVAVLAFALLQSLVLPVLPTIQASLHTSQATVTWVLTAYLLSASVATPILGRLGDMIGKRKVLIAVLVMLGAGALLAAVASSIAVLIVARVIQGAGGAVVPLAFGVVRDVFPAEKVASAVSKIAALLGVGSGLGIVLAGPIVDTFSYHFLFWIPLIVVVTAAIGAYLLVPESSNPTPVRISVLPGVLMMGWLVTLLVALSEASTWGWASGWTVGLIALSATLIVAWVFSELRAAHPLIDMKMMRIPEVWTTNLVSLLLGMPLFTFVAFLPEFVQTPRSAGYGFGASITASGLLLLPMTVGMFISALWSGRLIPRFGPKLVLLTGSALTAASLVILILAHDRQWEIYLVSAGLGMGLGFAIAAMSTIIVASVPPSQTSVASGMNANIRTIGGAIGAAGIASLVTSHLAANHIPTETGYVDGFLFLLVGTVLATIAALIIPTARRRSGESAHPRGAGPREGGRADDRLAVARTRAVA